MRLKVEDRAFKRNVNYNEKNSLMKGNYQLVLKLISMMKLKKCLMIVLVEYMA